MKQNTPYFPYNDEIIYDDEMNVTPEHEYTGIASAQPLDEEEARAYSSVYDIPLSCQHKKYMPKQ